MKILIIYDSMYGNTEKIAKELAKTVSKSNQVKVLKVSEAKISDLKSVDWLIVGSPTHGGQASQPMQVFIKSIPNDGLKGIKLSTFDTGIPSEGQKWGLKILIKVLGYAAPRIARSLEAKGAKLVGKPETFMVKDKEGPILEKEMERAKEWGRENLKIVVR